MFIDLPSQDQGDVHPDLLILHWLTSPGVTLKKENRDGH